MRSLLDVAEPALRDELGGLNAARLAQRCARLRPGTDITDPTAATKTALRSLGRRHQALSVEIDALRPLLERAVTAAAPPALLAEHGVGTDTAAALLIAAGDNPHRMHSDAAFAALCGVAPVDASSGRQQRHRLNRGGNRDANNALWRIVLVKMATDTETRDFIAERLARQDQTRSHPITQTAPRSPLLETPRPHRLTTEEHRNRHRTPGQWRSRSRRHDASGIGLGLEAWGAVTPPNPSPQQVAICSFSFERTGGPQRCSSQPLRRRSASASQPARSTLDRQARWGDQAW